MAKKRLVLALGHDALGTNLPEQKTAVTKTAKAIADFIQDGWQVVITHGNTPQLGMIHTALNEFAKNHEGYTPAPMSVCSAMSQGYIGYDLQNALRSELIKRGIYKAVSTILTQVTVDPYDESSYTPMKVVGRVMNAEEAKEEEAKGNFVVKEGDGYRRIVAAPKPVAIVEIDAIRALADADQPVIAAGGIADGRGMAAAMMLGAEGVQCGTVFLASNECYISDKYKELVLKATDISTVVTGRPSGHPVRSLKTPMARKCLELEKQNTNASLEELEKATAGSLRKAVQDGNYEEGTFMSGQIAGMLKELHPCEEILKGMTAQAEDLLKNAYKRFE